MRPRSRKLLWPIAVAVLLLAQAGLLAYAAYVHSPVYDETGHLPAGASWWLLGRTELYPHNPPLVKVWAARRGALLAAELKVRAEWKLGEWLRANLPRGGDHRSPARSRSILRRLGIDPHQSSRWQQIASLTEEAFEALVQQARRQRRELTTNAAVRAADPLAGAAGPSAKPPAPSGAGPTEGEADRSQRLAEIHRHAAQAARLLAPAFAVQPAPLQRTAWRNVERLIREIGEFSGPEAGRR
jgi:hypothetical protein